MPNCNSVASAALPACVAFTAKVNDGVMAGCVEVNVGGGGPQQAQAWREANANYLTDPGNRDPISGFPVLKALLCEVEKITEFTPEPSPVTAAMI